MQPEHHELVKGFLRKWSTIELTPESRTVLREDVLHIRVLLEIDEVDTSILDGAEHALDRHWFAKKYQNVVSKE